MNEEPKTPVDRDTPLGSLAAELTLAAYRVALRTRTEGTWLDLELALWRAMADTIRTREGEWPRCPPADRDEDHDPAVLAGVGAAHAHLMGRPKEDHHALHAP